MPDLYELTYLLNDALEFTNDYAAAADTHEQENTLQALKYCLQAATQIVEDASSASELVQVGTFTFDEKIDDQSFSVTLPDYRNKEVYRDEQGLAFAAQIKQVAYSIQPNSFDSAQTKAAIEALLANPYYTSLLQSLDDQEANERDE